MEHNNRTLYHFYQLCQIPRGSGNEKGVSDFVCKWARELGLEAKQDEIYNVIIKKPAAPGYEDIDSILLQAHLDMVCDKEPGVEHDFLKDPIRWKIEDGWIYAEKHTTLGADCGIGVALIMAMLEDKNLPAPKMEVLLTVREETDMAGAYHVCKEDFQAKRIINLDISPDNRLLMGSCSGEAIEAEIPVERYMTETKTATITISGLKGGHSGSDIHRGRGNAIVLLGKILAQARMEGISFQLVRIHGGNSRLAISRDAEAEIMLLEDDAARLKEYCVKANEMFCDTWQLNGANLEIAVKISNEKKQMAVFTESSTDKIIRVLRMLPNGVGEMSDVLPGNVESSSNLGIVRTIEQGVKFVIEIRGNHSYTRNDIEERIKLVAENFGGSCKVHSEYPEWRYQKESKLRDLILREYYDKYQQDMECVCVHAGNEVGILLQKLDIEDAVAMGPTRLYFHTPKEKLQIESVVEFEVFLKNILKQLR